MKLLSILYYFETVVFELVDIRYLVWDDNTKIKIKIKIKKFEMTGEKKTKKLRKKDSEKKGDMIKREKNREKAKIKEENKIGEQR